MERVAMVQTTLAGSGSSKYLLPGRLEGVKWTWTRSHRFRPSTAKRGWCDWARKNGVVWESRVLQRQLTKHVQLCRFMSPLQRPQETPKWVNLPIS